LPSPCVAPVDRNRMRQVFANLLDNAIKYTPENGAITITVLEETGSVLVRFRDTGIGIAPEEHAKVWERLYRSDKSRSQRGLGLGLSLVKAVVEAHQGRVTLASQPGQGAEFIVTLPKTADSLSRLESAFAQGGGMDREPTVAEQKTIQALSQRR